MVSQELPAPGKRRLMGSIAEKEAQAEFDSFEQIQLSVVARLKQAWYRRDFAHAASQIAQRNLAILTRFLRITEARYAAAKAQQQDIFKAQTQISILETKLLQLDREKRAREAELNSLAGRAPGAPLAPPAALQAVEQLPALDSLYAAARENSPMLARDEKMIQRAELASNLSRRSFLPDTNWRAGYFNMGSMPDMFQFAVDIRLPAWFFRKQRAQVLEQSHRLAETKKTLEATAQSLLFRIQDDHLMAATSLQLARLYRDTVIPQAGLTLESSLASYETGALDFLTILMNYSTVVEYEMNYQEELLNLHLALARLEEMTAKELLP
jgi:outer membrane protein TolC